MSWICLLKETTKDNGFCFWIAGKAYCNEGVGLGVMMCSELANY